MGRKLAIIMLLLLVPLASADVFNVDMKTNEIYTAEYNTRNVDTDVLKNCAPSFQGDLNNANWTYVQPEIFDMGPNDEQEILVVFDHPPAGYYEDIFRIRCERYFNDEFIGVVDILHPADEPVYNILVREAASGQAYRFQPQNYYDFLAKPGGEETAKFNIVNTGTEDLDIVFLIPPDAQGIIEISPQRITVDEGEVKTFTIEVDVPTDFISLQSNVTVKIGDYEDSFMITGERESLAAGGAGLASVAFGDIDVGNFSVPGYIVIIVLLVSGYFLFKDEFKKRRKKR